MRSIQQHGFFSWIFWALFSWQGRMRRGAYLASACLSMAPALAYVLILAAILPGDFLFNLEDADGELPPQPEGLLQRLLLLPPACMDIMRDAKRLRDIRLPPRTAVFVRLAAILLPLNPIDPSPLLGFFTICFFCFLLIYWFSLLCVPSAAGPPPPDPTGPGAFASGQEFPPAQAAVSSAKEGAAPLAGEDPIAGTRMAPSSRRPRRILIRSWRVLDSPRHSTPEDKDR
ncbi:MAG: hypothetical protein LBO77_08220 [Desulfovibrio sp.]|nr:hypothetical protein [Desulfovibrio sp.]